MKDDTKNRYYIEFELHVEEPITVEELVALGDDLVEFTKQHNCYPPKVMIKKDPTYDSFGELWE